MAIDKARIWKTRNLDLDMGFEGNIISGRRHLQCWVFTHSTQDIVSLSWLGSFDDESIVVGGADLSWSSRSADIAPSSSQKLYYNFLVNESIY